eukprot:comp24333_c4_seq2/m.46049 comp24333_c4_seq2/g.46049  ORF comp24333_c4_seq2/g.46049 comp24333_c4_seq2/m.46049 type:complete len:294 (-) comp24333_c4_seq2:284-1165(-)
MEMEEQPWVPLRIGGDTYLTKCSFRLEGYTLLVTDMLTVWKEEISAPAMRSRNKELNPHANMTIESTVKILRECMDTEGAQRSQLHKVNTEEHGDSLVLGLTHRMGEVTLVVWRFVCSRQETSAQLLYDQLLHPVMVMYADAMRMVGKLGQMVRDRDRDILTGRRRPDQAMFDMDEFTAEYRQSKELEQLASEDPTRLVEGSATNHYRAVAAAICESKKRAAELLAASLGTQHPTIDPSLPPSFGVSSSKQSDAPPQPKVSEKELELARREELKKKLAESEAEKQRKKPKRRL